MKRIQFVVSQAEAGKRLDQALASCDPSLSRRKARVLLDLGGVFVDGKRVKVSSRVVREGQRIEAHVGSALESATKAVGREARERDEAKLPQHAIVYDDRELCVVEKPAGLLTAPTPESDRNNLKKILEVQTGSPIWVVHRIDLQTSGLLVFAKTPTANRFLSELFRAHDLDREYSAIVAGIFPVPETTVELEIEGRMATTHFRCEETLADQMSMLRCRLETGRTHQIRIHANSLGHPVLGDPLFAKHTKPRPPRMALHAARLGFVHPVTRKPLEFVSPLPGDLAHWLSEMRNGLGNRSDPA